MKSFILRVFIALSSILMVNNVSASHYAGSELTYRNIGGASYEVTLSFYRDCSGFPAPSDAVINFSCSSNSAYSFNVTLSPYGTPVETTNICSQVTSSCSGGSAFGVTKVIYQGTVTMPPCGDWNMYWASGARNAISTVTNIPNWYIPAELNNLVGVNSSPIFNNDMISIARLNQHSVFDCGGVDPDGDSLSYSFYNLYTEGPNPLLGIMYNYPYDSAIFITSSTPITLNPITGEIGFTPTQILTSAYGIKVEEWRNINGVMTKVGVTYRDHTLNVVASNSSAPELSGIDTTASHTYSPNNTNYTINKCFDGSPITFSISGFDYDVYDPANTGSPEIFDISWNSGINGAIFTPYNNGTDSAYAEFYWLPTSSDIGNNSFTATVMDYACTYNLSNKYTFTINLFNTPPDFNLGNDTLIANGADLGLYMPGGFTDYLWSDGSTYSTIIINNSSFDWQNEIIGIVTEGGVCSSTDTILVSIGNVGITSPEISEVKVYPNPIDDVIYVSIENEVENAILQLYDINGKLVRSVEFSSKEYTLNGLSDLSSGNYFMKITIDNKEFEYPIIKK